MFFSADAQVTDNLRNAIARRVHGISDLIARHPSWKVEGSAPLKQLLDLANLVRSSGAKLIAEIGFNEGFSSCAFLEADQSTRVISFDIGTHPYVKTAKRMIRRHYQGRHRLVIGDSTVTIPAYAREHANTRFDLIFIDGGHAYRTAKADILNMRKLASRETIVVMDDLTPWLPWGVGPFMAWTEMRMRRVVVQEEIHKVGHLRGRRIWAWGHYK